MYLIINNERYTVSRRLVSADEIKYLSVEPQPDVSGLIRMYRDDGFEMSTDNADSFAKHTYTGTLLVLSNIPDPVPVPEPEPGPYVPTEQDDTNAMLVDHEYRLTLLELGLTDF